MFGHCWSIRWWCAKKYLISIGHNCPSDFQLLLHKVRGVAKISSLDGEVWICIVQFSESGFSRLLLFRPLFAAKLRWLCWFGGTIWNMVGVSARYTAKLTNITAFFARPTDYPDQITLLIRWMGIEPRIFCFCWKLNVLCTYQLFATVN